MKRITVFLVIVLMFGCMSIPVAAGENTREYSWEMLEVAENLLLDLGLWKEFNLDEIYLTRAEAAVIACQILDAHFEEYFLSPVELYKDVPVSHWASNWINTASYYSFRQASYGDFSPFNGYGNGCFYPDEKITYQEFVKILVVSLGWGIYAEYSEDIPNTYPESYLKIADFLGIYRLSKDEYEQSLTKDDAIIMVYNALKAPGFQKKGFGIIFEAYDWLEDRSVVQVRGYANKKDDNTVVIDGKEYYGIVAQEGFKEGFVLCFYNKNDNSIVSCYPISSLSFDNPKEISKDIPQYFY